jgi:hypothetical protein
MAEQYSFCALSDAIFADKIKSKYIVQRVFLNFGFIKLSYSQAIYLRNESTFKASHPKCWFSYKYIIHLLRYPILHSQFISYCICMSGPSEKLTRDQDATCSSTKPQGMGWVWSRFSGTIFKDNFRAYVFYVDSGVLQFLPIVALFYTNGKDKVMFLHKYPSSRAMESLW